MADFRNSPFVGTLDVVATLRDRQIEASIDELRRHDELTLALRGALDNGVDISSLSDASGLTVEAIKDRVARDLHLGEDLAGIAGTR